MSTFDHLVLMSLESSSHKTSSAPGEEEIDGIQHPLALPSLPIVKIVFRNCRGDRTFFFSNHILLFQHI